MRRANPWLAWAAGAAALLLGFVLGGLGPRLEVERREATIARLEDELYDARRSANTAPTGSVFESLGMSAGGDEPAFEPAEPARRGYEPPPERREARRPPAHRDAGPPEPRRRRAWRSGWSETRRRHLRDARSAFGVMPMRRVQARAALAMEGGLDAEQEAQVDDVIARMNDELVALGEEALPLLESEEPPPTSVVLGLSSRIAAAMQRGQGGIEEALGPRAAEIDPSLFEAWNFLDVSALEAVLPPSPE